MDDIRKSLSRTKKKIKDRLKGKGRKVDRTGADTGEEASSTSSFPQPDPHIIVGGDQNQEGRRLDIEERGSGQRNLHPKVEVAVRSGPSQEGNDVDRKGPDRVDPPPSMPSITHSDCTWRGSIQLLPLIVSLDNADDPAAPDQVQEALSPNQSEPNAAGENKWKTASATTKILLRGVKESADAFPPLKSVAGGLYFILENWEVRPYFHWGQGGTYPGDTLRIHCDFIINVSRHYPGDKCWNLLQSILHFDHNVSSDHMLVTFSMYPSK